MEANVDEISREVAALTQRFVDLGASLDEAARALQEDGAPPANGLVEALAGAHGRFVELRTQTLSAAAAAGVRPDGEPQSLHELEPVLTAIGDALRARARQQALEQVRHVAVATLDRVLELVHGDDPKLAALVDCQARASELRTALLALAELDTDDARRLVEGVGTFGDLLSMVESRDALDDDQYAQLEASVSHAFGRGLSVAAARGRLGFEGDFPEPEPAAAPDEPGHGDPETVAAVEAEPEGPALESVAGESAPEPGVSPESVLTPDELQPELQAQPEPALQEEPVAQLEPAPDLEPGPEVEPALEPEPSSESEPGAVLETVVAAVPEPEPEVAADPSAPDETAQWWLAAWARWSSWKSTLEFPAAVREELGKYPYLLSVPIQKSPDYEDGLVAYGYSILMDHVERQNPGCVGNALNSLKPGQARPVGAQLYDYLIAQGRLHETYPDFLKRILAAAIPEPGVWFQFRILESREDTRILQRPTGRIGDPELSGHRLAADAQRYSDHKFTMTLGALTTRFVLVSADVREARGVGFKVVRDGTPCDDGWVVTVSAGGRAGARADTKRLGADGLHVTGLGKDYGAVWVAVFNADPQADHRYELTVSLRKDTRSPFRTKG